MTSVVSNVYISSFNGAVVFLDTENDKYITLNDRASKVVHRLLSEKKLSASECGVVQELIEAGFITENSSESANSSNVSVFLKGFEERKLGLSNIDWRMPYGNLNKNVNLYLFVEAYFTLIQVNYLFKKNKILGIIKRLKMYDVKKLKKTVSQSRITELSVALDNACFLFTKKIRCLEWAAVLTLMCLRRNIKAIFKIGVQNYPFLAHAWVEIDGEVVADDPNVNRGLSVIFSNDLDD